MSVRNNVLQFSLRLTAFVLYIRKRCVSYLIVTL